MAWEAIAAWAAGTGRECTTIGETGEVPRDSIQTSLAVGARMLIPLTLMLVQSGIQILIQIVNLEWFGEGRDVLIV